MRFSDERRLVIVENPRNGNARKVAREVFGLLDDHGVPYERIVSRYSDTESNISMLSDQLREGDRIIAAAGDGTASQLSNAVLLSGADAEVGFLPYGNFNDLASAHTRIGSTVLDLLEVEPTVVTSLKVSLDGHHWRYAPAYTTIGWSAAAADSFNHPVSRFITRNTLSPLRLGTSLLQVACQYYLHRGDKLPDFTVNGSPPAHHDVTDIIAVNTSTIAGAIGSTREWYRGDDFGYSELNVSHFFANVKFGLQSLARHMPLVSRQDIDILFENTASLLIQHEGEASRVTARQISIRKDSSTTLQVLRTKG